MDTGINTQTQGGQSDIEEDYAEALKRAIQNNPKGKLLDMCCCRLTPIEDTQDGQHESNLSEYILNRFMRSN